MSNKFCWMSIALLRFSLQNPKSFRMCEPLKLCQHSLLWNEEISGVLRGISSKDVIYLFFNILLKGLYQVHPHGVDLIQAYHLFSSRFYSMLQLSYIFLIHSNYSSHIVGLEILLRHFKNSHQCIEILTNTKLQEHIQLNTISDFSKCKL